MVNYVSILTSILASIFSKLSNQKNRLQIYICILFLHIQKDSKIPSKTLIMTLIILNSPLKNYFRTSF